MGSTSSNGRVDDRHKRRKFLSASSALLFAAEMFSGKSRAQSPPARREPDRSATSVGPDNHILDSLNASSISPPATDEGDAPGFWHSFSLVPRRVFAGGWSRQINARDFPLAREIAAVNLRLTAGGVRAQHWNPAAEFGFVLSGNVRLTAVNPDGRSYSKKLGMDDIWYLPAGTPHSLQGLGPDGCAILMAFDTGAFSETNSTELSDWLRHTPRDVLARNLSLKEADLEAVYKIQNSAPIYQASLETASSSLPASDAGGSRSLDIGLKSIQPAHRAVSTELRIIDSEKLPIATSIAAAHVTVKPGGIRAMHWHPDADEWQFFLQGKGRMTIFFNSSRARTTDFSAGDVGYVPKALGHYVQNTGSSDLIFLELLRANRFREFSLLEWVQNTPPELVTRQLGISREALNAILGQQPVQ